MTAVRNARRRLDTLLSGLEDDILMLDDVAVLSEEPGSVSAIENVRELIQSRIAADSSTNQSPPKTNQQGVSPRHRGMPSETTPLAIPDEDVDLRRLLETLIANQPTVPEPIRLAFAAGRQPTGAEVDAVVTQLVRLGVLKPPRKDS